MAILVLSEQFIRKICHIFGPNFEHFTNNAFCSHSFDYVWRHLRLNGGSPKTPPMALGYANAHSYWLTTLTVFFTIQFTLQTKNLPVL